MATAVGGGGHAKLYRLGAGGQLPLDRLRAGQARNAIEQVKPFGGRTGAPRAVAKNAPGPTRQCGCRRY
jgi:hypothetical protein